MSEQGVPEQEADTFCPEGHEAVTCSEQLPANRVQMVLRPAARIVDTVRQTIWFADLYYVVLLDRADRELRMSKQQYTWDDAIKLAAQFKGMDERAAIELWTQQGL